MRRLGYIMLLAVVAMGVSEASAQHYVGVRAGYGGATSRFYPDRDMKYLWGLYNGGISWKYYSRERVVGAVQVDVELLQRGYKIKESSYADTSYYIRRLNSVIVPFAWQPHVYFFDRKLRVYFNAAVTLSYNFDATEEYTSQLNSPQKPNYDERKYDFILNRDNRFGYGLMGGLGFGYLTGRFEFFFEGRYHFGYADIMRNLNIYPGNPLRSPLDNINFSFGAYYRLGKGDILAPRSVKKVKVAPEEDTKFERKENSGSSARPSGGGSGSRSSSGGSRRSSR